jgi:spore maturation protein CgeB
LSDFFRPGSEILIGESGQDVSHFLTDMSEEERRGIGEAVRRRVLASHTASCRASELETHLLQLCRPEHRVITGDPQSRETV